MESTTVSHELEGTRLFRSFARMGAAICLLGVVATHLAVAEPEEELLDALRNADAVTYRQAALAALAAGGEVDLASIPSIRDETVEAVIRGAIPLKRTGLDEEITTAQFAFLLAEALPIPGGLMYRIFPSPRYALRDLRFYDILPAELAAQEELDGRTALGLLSRARAWVVERDLEMDSARREAES